MAGVVGPTEVTAAPKRHTRPARRYRLPRHPLQVTHRPHRTSHGRGEVKTFQPLTAGRSSEDIRDRTPVVRVNTKMLHGIVECPPAQPTWHL